MRRIKRRLEGPKVIPERLASCAECGQLMLLVYWPYPVAGEPYPFLRWNPGHGDRDRFQELLELEGSDAGQGFGPHGSLHRDTCEGRHR